VTQDLDLLIGDTERADAVSSLRGHYEAGRLTLEELETTLEELETRLDEVNAARTESDLRAALRQLPEKSLPTLNPRDRRWSSLALQYLALNAIAVLVWLASGAESDFWPKWVFVATAVVFVRRAIGIPHEPRGLARRLPPASPPPPDEPPA
jgi:hypothetical protein